VHPVILQELAAERIKAVIAEADDARRARQARRARRSGAGWRGRERRPGSPPPAAARPHVMEAVPTDTWPGPHEADSQIGQLADDSRDPAIAR
jgi:hypothetical protein